MFRHYILDVGFSEHPTGRSLLATLAQNPGIDRLVLTNADE